jgi:hypothetical protein
MATANILLIKKRNPGIIMAIIKIIKGLSEINLLYPAGQLGKNIKVIPVFFLL